MRRTGLLKVDNLSSFFYIRTIKQELTVQNYKARINCTLKGISSVNLPRNMFIYSQACLHGGGGAHIGVVT